MGYQALSQACTDFFSCGFQRKPKAPGLVRQFEEKAARTGRRSLIKDVESYAQQLGLGLELQYPQPVGVTETGNVLDRKKFNGWIKKVNQSRGCAEIESERWQGKLIAERWRDEDVRTKNVLLGCQIGKQLQSRKWRDYKSYISDSCQLRKTKTHEKCRLFQKAQESVAHVVSGCSALAQTLYLTRHNSATQNSIL